MKKLIEILESSSLYQDLDKVTDIVGIKTLLTKARVQSLSEEIFKSYASFNLIHIATHYWVLQADKRKHLLLTLSVLESQDIKLAKSLAHFLLYNSYRSNDLKDLVCSFAKQVLNTSDKGISSEGIDAKIQFERPHTEEESLGANLLERLYYAQVDVSDFEKKPVFKNYLEAKNKVLEIQKQLKDLGGTT